MNANELADELDEAVMKLVANNHFFEAQAVEKAQTMLRQQQSEIEALKAEIVSIEKNTDYWADKANWIKNNEPVAWMRESDKAVCSNEEKLWFIEEEGSDWNYVIPLYTHPHPDNLGLAESIIKQQQAEIANLKAGLLSHHDIYPVKELTDEKIMDIGREMFESPRWPSTAIEFARAILRKEQEK